MRFTRAMLVAQLCATSILTPWITGCSDDDDGTGPNSPLVGSWNATSIVALGNDLIALGMDLTLTLSEAGDYTLDISGDLIGACEPNPSCTQTGAYTNTETEITLDPGTAEEVTLSYVIQGTTLTLTGAINGTPVAFTFARD